MWFECGVLIAPRLGSNTDHRSSRTMSGRSRMWARSFASAGGPGCLPRQLSTVDPVSWDRAAAVKLSTSDFVAG